VVTLAGGELLAEALRRADVEVVFALHGGHLNPFLRGCADNGIRLVDGRHEAALGNMADGYARATGGIGVVAVTAGAGFANVLPAIVSAHVDRVPLVVITSSPPLRESELNELQGGVDQTAIVGPITRWAHRVTAAERIPDLLALAIRKARGTPPGPVLLDVPVDQMYRPVDRSALDTAATTDRASTGIAPAPAARAVSAALDVLRGASRPVLVAGNGVRWSGASAALVDFAERTGIPVFHQIGTWGLPAGHPLNGYGAWNLAAIEEATGRRPDVVLLAGARLGRFLGGRSGSMVPDAARVIQIDVDSTEIGRVRPVDVPVVADVGEALLALAEPGVAWPDWSQWAAAATSVSRRPSRFAADPEHLDGRMHPYFAVREVFRAVGPGATIVVDGGEAAGWAWENLAGSQPADVLGFGGYLGILGLATGLAMGVQVARPGERVVLVCGDGAAGFHFQEFDTMRRHDLPVLVCILNNASWAQSVRTQTRDYGPDGGLITSLLDTDYDVAARGFGAHAERVSSVRDVAAAVRRGLASGLPVCLNLDVSATPEPRTAAGMGKAPVADEIALPYYESVPVSAY
jgi:acetolactate synthase I/II/III large subunit